MLASIDDNDSVNIWQLMTVVEFIHSVQQVTELMYDLENRRRDWSILQKWQFLEELRIDHGRRATSIPQKWHIF